MSIYPRIVKIGETVKIHINLKNTSKKYTKPCVVLIIEKPNGHKITIFKKNVNLPPNTEINKEFFYKTKNNDPQGKYIVNLFMKYNGKVILSQTKETDFFEVKAKN